MPPQRNLAEILHDQMQERWHTQTALNGKVFDQLNAHSERLAIIETKVFYIAAGFGFLGSTCGSLMVGLVLWFVRK